ncbi:glycosyltransferase [Nocardioides perillae]|uniref:Glycosyltransferase involved in cell wall biosynthesis n=1 Tax=Nocardioides perillae TaxID=1119534 RepID=A0A7Y9URQ2_9ACTN|nr:glycosyltransferase involved in cell wall biosynthesis [Nocardioides perillae]
MENVQGPRVLFQVHPLASQIRDELAHDRELSGLEVGLEPEELLDETDVQRERGNLEAAHSIICASSFVAKGLSASGVPSGRVHVAPYGADRANTYRGAGTPARSATNRPLQLLWVGQLAYRKGPHWLVKAMREFSSKEVVLTMVTRSAVPTWLAPLPENVRIINNASAEDLRGYYATTDLFVMPSIIEGFGLVYSEALAHGVPIVATANSGAPDVAQHGRNSWLVHPGTSDAIVDLIDALLLDRSLLTHLREGAEMHTPPTWPEFRHDVNLALLATERSFIKSS